MSVAHRVRATVLVPAALLAVGGCLATRSDVEQVQLGLTAMRDSLRAQQAAQARSDSATRAVIRDATQQLSQQFGRQFATMSDSVRGVSSRLQRFQGDVTLAVHDLNAQLVTVQEGIGVSQKRISELRTTVEAIPAAPPVAPPATGTPAGGRGATPVGTGAPSAPAAPPAAQLWTLGRDFLIKGATASARENLQTLVDNYPNYDRTPEAQMLIADAYDQEGNKPAADSVYAMVVTKYGGTAQASRSLYKRARYAIEAGNKDQARAFLQQILDKYPKSDEAFLAEGDLKALNKP